MLKLLALAGIAFVISVGQGSAFTNKVETLPSLPDAMVGDWCSATGITYSRGRCSFGTDGKLFVRARGYEFTENGCDVVTARQIKRSVYLVHSDCAGEGMMFTEDVMFHLDSGRLSLTIVNRSKEQADEAAAPDLAPSSSGFLPCVHCLRKWQSLNRVPAGVGGTSQSVGSELPASPTMQDAPSWLKKR